jgi:hypothetical protein
MIGVSESLDYLNNTDEVCAQAKASMRYYEHHLKTVKALVYSRSTGTQKDKEAMAYTSVAYEDAKVNYRNAVCDYETYYNKRKTAELTIEVWRSQNANRRSGNI